ncbi:enoyl-CoA hydratase-related protein [Siccirubricoccus deserti]
MAAFEELRGKARAIILTGTGVAFCAGMDLKEREQDRQAGIEGAGDEWVAVNMAIRAHPAIFIAAVNGLALGGGATLINVCDLAIASTKASIGCPEMGFSTYPGMAGPAIQLSGVTRKQAAWLVLTTNRIDGATAERWGMVNQCVEPEALLPTAQALAQKVAHSMPWRWPRARRPSTASPPSSPTGRKRWTTGRWSICRSARRPRRRPRAAPASPRASRTPARGSGAWPWRRWPAEGCWISAPLRATAARPRCLHGGAALRRLWRRGGAALPSGGEPFAATPPLLPDGGSALDRFLNAGKRQGATTGRFDVAIGDRASLAAHAEEVPVKARISVFGPGEEDPPMTELGLMALSGLFGIVGEAPPAPPARLAGHQVSYSAGLAACMALLAALLAGGEEVVDVSLLDVAAWLNWKVAAGVMVMGSAPVRGGARVTWFTVPAKDGHMALVYQDKDWPPLRDLIGDPRLRDDPRFATGPARGPTGGAARGDRPWFAARTRAEITAAAQAKRVPLGR